MIGDNCIDIYQYGTVDRISPEAPVPVFKFSHEECRPGMAGNVYNNLLALGCDVHFLHIDTSTKTRLVDIRSRQHIVRIDNDKVSTPLSIDEILPFKYDIIVISDYDKGTISYELIEELRVKFTGPIFIDTKKKDLARLEGCVIKINLYESNLLISRPTRSADMIITLGDCGAEWNGTHFPAVRVAVSDVCGAGDTFLSALVYKYIETNDMGQSIQFAIRASAITVQHLGCYAPRLNEII